MEKLRKDGTFSFSVILIGRNEGQRLLACIKSVRAMKGDFPPPEIIYVDSASSDGSSEKAREAGVRTIELLPGGLCAAKARNAGWKATQKEFVLFLDGDTILAPDFVEKARKILKDPSLAAVCGNRREIDPTRNFFHRACDLEWRSPYGEVEYFGGDALVRRKVLEEVGGYNESLKAGEEPEMCGRIRQRGYKILHVNLPMTGHDLNMGTWGQYWRRAVRSGYAYAEVTDRFPKSAPPSWKPIPLQNASHGMLFLIAMVLVAEALLSREDFFPLWLFSIVLSVMFFQRAYKEQGKIKGFRTLIAHEIHSYLAKLPLLCGHTAYFWDKWVKRKKAASLDAHARQKDRGVPVTATRIAYLVSRYPAVSHTFILREICELRKKGIKISTFSINRSDHPFEKLTREEQGEVRKTYYVKARAFYDALFAHGMTLLTRPWRYFLGLFFALSLSGLDLRRDFYRLFYFGEAVIIGWKMRREHLADLHVHFANPAATAGLIVSKIFPIAFSMTIHGPTDFENVKGNCLRQKIKGAAFLCCISEFAKKQLMKFSEPADWEKIKVLPLGIETERFCPPELPPKQSPFEILCVGRLVPDKGHRVLIAAVERLIRAKEDIFLRLVGDGPDRTELERDVAARSLQRHVQFEGNVNQDQILGYYRKAGIFALASFAEGVPIVLMEAMAMEIPCISTVIAGIPELIENGKSGILVPSGNEQALADAIARLLKDPGLRQTIGAEGRRRIMEKYDLKKNMSKKAAYFFERLSKKQ